VGVGAGLAARLQVYTIRITDGATTWEKHKRFSDFDRLLARVRRACLRAMESPWRW